MDGGTRWSCARRIEAQQKVLSAVHPCNALSECGTRSVVPPAGAHRGEEEVPNMRRNRVRMSVLGWSGRRKGKNGATGRKSGKIEAGLSTEMEPTRKTSKKRNDVGLLLGDK